MLSMRICKHFNASDVFRLCENDIEGEFNEYYCPPCSGSIDFWIPSKEEMENESNYIREVAYVLVTYGGCNYGESVCLDFDY